MTSPLLGEFLGTMVLILLGNGVVAGVLLKGSKAEGSGWIVITAGGARALWGGGGRDQGGGGGPRDGRGVYGDRMRQQRRALESCRDIGFRGARRRPLEIRSLFCRAAPRSDCRRGARVAPLSAPLEGDTGWRSQTRLFLHRARNPSVHPDLGE